MTSNRIVVAGTYRSGSSALAGILHYLGVDMGGPFWGDHFEPADLSQALRRWWSEPKLVASIASRWRREHLRQWLQQRENHASIVGAKHPLLSLCGPELREAWGPETHFFWCQRPLEQSIESLQKLDWWPDAERIQQTLHAANESFFAQQEHVSVSFQDTLDNPREQVRRLTDTLGLKPTPSQVDNAVTWIEHRTRPDVEATGSLSNASVDRQLTHSQLPHRPEHTPVTDTPATEVQKPPPRIVATLLSGNSQELVTDAIESIVDWVDEICLIDTGITDQTVDRAAAAAGGKFACAAFTWCDDFAAARNAALKIAAERGATWALTLDTDERFAFPDISNRTELTVLLESAPEVQAWMVSNRDGSYSKERFIRVPSQLQWRGRTHEALTGAGAQHRQLLDGCHFWEVRKSTADYEYKVQRDLEILLEETASQPLNPRWWYYLGQTYEGLKKYREAVDAFERCIRLDGWPEESAWACYTAARCLTALEEFREAEEYCALGLSRKPTSPELPWLAGWCCFQRDALQPAVAWSHMAVALGRDKRVENAAAFRYVPAWYEAPYDVLRYALGQLGQLQAAELAEKDYTTALAERLKRHPRLDD